MERIIAVIPRNAHDEIRVFLHEYLGYQLVSARIYRSLDSKQAKGPTRKGLTVDVKYLTQLVDALGKAHEALKLAGRASGGKPRIVPRKLSNRFVHVKEK